jgi:RHS repeat-associated protein
LIEIIQKVPPDMGATTYVRDPRGLVTQRTDGRGIVTNFTYDNAGRLTGQTYPANAAHHVTLTWDVSAPPNYGVGRLGVISDESGVSSRVFDAKGRIVTDSRVNAPATAVNTTAYSYDASGNIASMTYPSGRIVTYSRDAQGRISGVATQPSASGTASTLASGVTWQPFGGVASFTFGNGITATFGYDSDYRINSVTAGNVVSRALAWTGETLDQITNNLDATQTETLTYSQNHRLASAAGYYGTFAWTYDANGNRTSETAGAVASAYAYRANSNLLASITPAGGTARSFAYVASGNIVGDTRNGALGLSFAYDENGRLSQAYQTNNPLEDATYSYDARWWLASRAITHAAAPGTTITYIHDIRDHIIAETDQNGVTQREYIWLDDLPVAVVDAVATAPVIYYVHTDHLFRPVAMTDAGQNIAWSAIYQPFGAAAAINAQNTTMDLRFPGQWFQLETGLHYNWHRHYDPTTGRYLQPDPLIVDDGAASVGGLSTVLTETTSSVSNGALLAEAVGRGKPDTFLPKVAARTLLPDGPSVYDYAAQNPLVRTDDSGLIVGPFGSLQGILSSKLLQGGNCHESPEVPIFEQIILNLKQCFFLLQCLLGGDPSAPYFAPKPTRPPPPPPAIVQPIRPEQGQNPS